jgi:hypothetical protein
METPLKSEEYEEGDTDTGVIPEKEIQKLSIVLPENHHFIYEREEHWVKISSNADENVYIDLCRLNPLESSKFILIGMLCIEVLQYFH